MLMRIGEQYFQSLLSSHEALTAVFSLDRNWCARRGVSGDKPQFGLSEPEFTAHLCILYLGEVANGGHQQFFLNPTGAWAGETVEALANVGLPDLAEILREACAVFPGGVIPIDSNEREQVINAMSVAELQDWERLDHRLHGVDRMAFDVLLNYLRARQGEVLAPERGLATL